MCTILACLHNNLYPVFKSVFSANYMYIIFHFYFSFSVVNLHISIGLLFGYTFTSSSFRELTVDQRMHPVSVPLYLHACVGLCCV